MGGADAILQKAKQDYDRVISAGLPKVVSKVVFDRSKTTVQREIWKLMRLSS